jgi:segregation and condensation protein B
MEKKLVVTAGRKNVVGRPILYRTSRDFLVHFGLKDVSELPSLREFEELAKAALGSEWTVAEAGPSPREAPAAIEPSPQNDAGTAESMRDGTPSPLPEAEEQE